MEGTKLHSLIWQCTHHTVAAVQSNVRIREPLLRLRVEGGAPTIYTDRGMGGRGTRMRTRFIVRVINAPHRQKETEHENAMM